MVSDTDYIFSIVYVDLNRYDEAQVALISTNEGTTYAFIKTFINITSYDVIANSILIS